MTYVKEQGRENCEEFQKDMKYFFEKDYCPLGSFIKDGYIKYDSYSLLLEMLNNRNNFRKYMIEGGFIEEIEEEKFLKLKLQDGKIIDIKESDIIENTSRFINIRVGYEFKNKAMWLNDKYNWIIGEDSFGETVLVALKK
jgi:hypothetical protein